MAGLGGFFFKTRDPDKVRAWYRDYPGISTDQYGKFGRIMDPVGNKVGLWEPVDSAFL